MCIGSFLNVCIYRFQTSKNILKPARSECPVCKKKILFYHNIPVISYVWLKGRCHNCNSPISFRYPFLEITGGFFALCMLIKFGPTLTGSIYYIFIACLLVITFIDIDQQIIPDAITLPGILIFLGASFFIPESSFKDSATGIIAGGGILYTIAFFYNFITKTQGMGGGDIKLLAMIGAILGWKGVIFTIFTSSLLGTFSGIIIMLVQKKNMKLAIPFGPFLSMGAITYLFWGSSLIKWYLNLAQ